MDEEKWEFAEEEEEALSLCDLPVNLVKEDKQLVQNSNEAAAAIKTEDDFNFGSNYAKPEMCSADEVFFKGQILPLRLSVSSDSGLTTRCHGPDHNQNSRSPCLSRSGSMDYGSLSRFTSVSSSSRSSSTKSSSSFNTVTVTNYNFNLITKSSSRNNFSSHPSPKPQIRLSKSRPAVNFSSRNPKSSTSMWNFFRLGLVQAPELELKDLKVRSKNRNCVSRNSSCNSSNSSSSTKNQQKQLQQLDLSKGFLGLFSGCKCSVNVVETVPLNNIVVIKSNKEKEKAAMALAAAMEEKKKLLQELKMRKKTKEKEKEKKQEGKQALSRHRTFEWLKELSHNSSYVDEETLKKEL